MPLLAGSASKFDFVSRDLLIAQAIGGTLGVRDGFSHHFSSASLISAQSTNVDSTESGVVKPWWQRVAAEANYAQNYTGVDRSQAATNSKTITHVEVHSDVSQANVVGKICLQNSTTNFSIVAETATVNHGGTGWERIALSAPYAVPGSGDYRPGWYRPGGGTLSLTNVPMSYRLNNITGANQGSFTAATSGMQPMKLVYSGGYDMELVTIGHQLAAAPSTVEVYLFAAATDGAAVNTDVSVWASRNNGTNWTQGTLISDGTMGTIAIWKAVINVSSQGPGSLLALKVATNNHKNIKFAGIAGYKK